MKLSLFDTMASWERLLRGAAANSGDLWYMESCRAELEAQLSDIRALQSRRAALREEMRQGTRTLGVFLARGMEMAFRLRAGIRAQYGTRSEKLLEFGMKPVQPGRRRRPAREKPGCEGVKNEAP